MDRRTNTKTKVNFDFNNSEDRELHSQWTQMMKSPKTSSKLLHLLSTPKNDLTIFENISRVVKNFMDKLNFKSLTLDQVTKVESFVLFLGYPRSGHSIVGTLMDSHPNMIIANEFPFMASLLSPPSRNSITKHGLFNALYLNSRTDMVYGKRGVYGLERKGYLLNINGSFQGQFDKLKVIGNKKGGQITYDFYFHSSETTAAFKWLQKEIGIPIHVLHVVRNPYDMIATQALYNAGKEGHKYKASESNKLNDTSLVKSATEQFTLRANAVVSMTRILHLNVLLVRHEDLVNEPQRTMLKICNFLHVNCTDDYLRLCKEKVDPNMSRSRNLITWTDHLRDRVDSLIEQFDFFNGYTINS